MCNECIKQGKGKVHGKMQKAIKSHGGMIKFSMVMHAHEVRILKNDEFVRECQEESGFKVPPAAIGFWSREILLLTGEIDPDTPLSVKDAVELIIDKLASEALNGIFKHARAKRG